MRTRSNARARLLLYCLTGAFVGLTWIPLPGLAQEEDALARRILADTGVQGGLVVHIGCGDAKLTAAFRQNDSYVVQGLAARADEAERAQAHVHSLALYGSVTIRTWREAHLPYVDNLVNLVVTEDRGRIPMPEVMRVLAPGGVACVKRGNAWNRTVKPRPDTIDDWPQFLYDAGNNAVNRDAVVDHPYHVQWVADPKQARHHEHLASITAVVSAGGRIFSIQDEAPAASILLPARWFLVARDAFNGVLLWKHAIPSWHPHLWRFRHGPPQLSRRLIAIGDKVYCTLGIDAPVVCLDAATGRTLKTYAGTESCEEMLWDDGMIYGAAAMSRTGVQVKSGGRAELAGLTESLDGWSSTIRGNAWDMSEPADVQGHARMTDIRFEDGQMRFTSERDARFLLDLGGRTLNAAYDLFAVRMYASERGKGQVYYWSPDGDWQGYVFPDVREGWHTYVVDLTDATLHGPGGGSDEHAAWGGQSGAINRLRFDPVEAAGIEFAIDWIKLVKGTDALRARIKNLEGTEKTLFALETDSGRIRWRKKVTDLMPTTLAAGGGRLYYQARDGLYCANGRSGEIVWDHRHETTLKRPEWSAPTLVFSDGILLSADRVRGTTPAPKNPGKRLSIGERLKHMQGPSRLTVFAGDTGKLLWDAPCAEGYNAAIDVFVIDGLVYMGTSAGRHTGDFGMARDLRTGEVKRQLDVTAAYTEKHHHRCYRNRATARHIVIGRTGVEYIDHENGHSMRHDWIRGGCQFGILPCNGLLYTPPHPCACYIQAKLNGFHALAPKRPARPAPATPQRLEKGPACESIGNPQSSIGNPLDWPTYRHDPQRSGATAGPVGQSLAEAWQAKPGGRITAPVIAGGKVLVARIDAHTVCALDAADGRKTWEYTAGGRVDSPPSVDGNRVLFGCADGWVYCLRASDGELAWRFRAAPEDRWMGAYGQIESAWPVHGSVLVHEGAAYVAAGRSSYLDGGMRFCKLDARTGELIAESNMYSRDPETGAQQESMLHDMDMGGALPDILSTDGESIFMRYLRLDRKTLKPQDSFLSIFEQDPEFQKKYRTGHALFQNPERGPHLFSPTGFLDDSWWHRSYWVYGTHFQSCCPYFRAGVHVPAGRILVYDDTHVYGFGRRDRYWGWWTPLEYHLFAALRQTKLGPMRPERNKKGPGGRHAPDDWQGMLQLGTYGTRVPHQWTNEVPLLVRAMVLAGKHLVIAGPPDVLDERTVKVRKLMYSDKAAREQLGNSLAAWEGKRGALLRVVSAADGNTVQEHRLKALPVFDGMAAAGGRLYISTQAGSVLCLAGDETARSR